MKTNKKGFTLVETVVAMAIILIICAIVSSLVIFTIKQTNKIDVKSQAVHETENIITCFRSDDFQAGIRFLYEDNTLTIDENTLTLYFNGAFSKTDEALASYTIVCTVSGSNNETVTVTTTSMNGDAIYEKTFTKHIQN